MAKPDNARIHVAFLPHPPQAPLGYRQHLGDEKKLGVAAVSGPHDGNYSVLNEPGRDGLGSEPPAVLTQNMVPGHDSRIGHTFTPGVVGIPGDG
jgi:hypothetical protein